LSEGRIDHRLTLGARSVVAQEARADEVFE
jgi:hypothetical protein